MTDKGLKTVEEQLDILRSRGLTINDEAQAGDFLLRNNYYRINGYSLTLRKNDVFSKSATFQNIIDIYHFDHERRHILLQYLEVIEVQMKSSGFPAKPKVLYSAECGYKFSNNYIFSSFQHSSGTLTAFSGQKCSIYSNAAKKINADTRM